MAAGVQIVVAMIANFLGGKKLAQRRMRAALGDPRKTETFDPGLQ
jgi:hypothetical protein